jgi:hypothetical protein
MSAVEVMKENPIKAASGIIASLSVILGAVFALDARYVHAGDISEIKADQSRAIQQLSTDNQVQINSLRKQMLEDKVFEIQLIAPSKRTDVDRARLDKYQRDLEEINTRIRTRSIN